MGPDSAPPANPPPRDLTRVLRAAAQGQPLASDELLSLIYSHLRAIAQQRMAQERKDHTLQATALVHETFLKLTAGSPIDWADRSQFYEAAARAMRQILVDHARARNTQKRGGGAQHQPLTELTASLDADPAQTLALHDALSRLEMEDPQLAAVVRLRFYAGLSGEQAAEVMGVSARKVDFLWAHARAWLFRELESGA